MKGNDLQFDRTRPPLLSLLAILRIEVWSSENRGPVANDYYIIATYAKCGKPNHPRFYDSIVKFAKLSRYCFRTQHGLWRWAITWLHPLCASFHFKYYLLLKPFLNTATSRRWLGELRHSRREPKGQEADGQAVQEGYPAQISVYHWRQDGSRCNRYGRLWKCFQRRARRTLCCIESTVQGFS